MKRSLKTILSLLCAASLLVSCSPADTGDLATAETAETVSDAAVYNLANIRQNIGEYTVVRADTAKKELTDASVFLRNTIHSITGTELTLATDWDGDVDNSARLEILIGKTNRAENEVAVSSLGDRPYIITEADGKILLYGKDDASTAQAVTDFLTQYFGYEAPEEVLMMHHDVRDYGAIGDGQTDDTEAFKAAVKAAEQDGFPVYVPAGTYNITDTIKLKSVTLYGYTSAAWTADSIDQPTINQGNMQAPLFDVNNASVAGLNIQSHGKAGDDTMQPTITITNTGGRVSNMRIHNPYIGIYTNDESNPGRCFIDNIFIVEAKEMGVFVAGTLDVPTLTNIEVWNPEETCPVAFKFGHNDDLRAVNLFAFNANVGFLIEKTDTGNCWASFSNCSVDYTSIGFKVSRGEHHLTIVGGTYWTHHLAIDVTPEFTGFLAASGCELKSNGDRTLRIQGGKTVSVTGSSIIHDFDTDSPAVSISGGKAVTITGNSIYSRPTAIELTHRKEGVVTITDNSIYTGGKEINNLSKNCIVKIDNTVLENASFD